MRKNYKFIEKNWQNNNLTSKYVNWHLNRTQINGWVLLSMSCGGWLKYQRYSVCVCRMEGNEIETDARFRQLRKYETYLRKKIINVENKSLKLSTILISKCRLKFAELEREPRLTSSHFVYRIQQLKFLYTVDYHDSFYANYWQKLWDSNLNK